MPHFSISAPPSRSVKHQQLRANEVRPAARLRRAQENAWRRGRMRGNSAEDASLDHGRINEPSTSAAGDAGGKRVS